jgi:tetratricopeptide (TPR) repeat protein
MFGASLDIGAWNLEALTCWVLDVGCSMGMQARDDLFDDANGDLAIGELESAVEKYRRCVQIDPEFFDGWHALGMALMKIGRFPEAIEAGRKATELRPNDQIGWTSLSLFYNRNGDIKEAEAAGTKAKILSWGGKVAKE